MGKISSLPEKEKAEIIGFLAQPGIISNITAEVPLSKIDAFKEKYNVMPYPINSDKKYGNQFRVYFYDPNICPPVLKQALDTKYARLNDSAFIQELVDDYGFKFFCSSQNTEIILEKAKSKSQKVFNSFLKGLNSNESFISDLKQATQSNANLLPSIEKVLPSQSKKKKRKNLKANNSLLNTQKAGLSDSQLQYMGWYGEKYIYNLISSKNEELLKTLEINPNSEIKVEWFNKGFEEKTNWEDGSVGYGCDIMVINGERTVFLEVKTSRRNTPIFTMTSNEMQHMKDKKSDYYIVKINNFEKLILNGAPTVKIFTSPYDIFFEPTHIYSATFYCD